MRRHPPELIALTPGDLDERGLAALVERAAAAAEAGLRGILLRERRLFDRDFLSLAAELRAALGPGGWLGVHDRAHLARAAGADALHVGWSSLPVDAARALVGAGFPLGFSAHADDPADLRAGADHLFLAPIAPTASHPRPDAVDWRPPLGVEGFAAERARDDRPTWALGGVAPALVPGLRRAGASGVAVLGAVLGAPTPAAASAGVAGLLAAWEAAA